MTLREQLLQKPRPTYQRIDAESLEWIYTHKPSFHVIPEDTVPFKRLVSHEQPWNVLKEHHYVSTEVYHGIHGRMHAIRVAINALFLLADTDLCTDPHITRAVVLMALLHDSRRETDTTDEQHGFRAGEWLRECSELDGISPDLREAIISAVKYHNIPYDTFITEPSYLQHQYIVELLRTADALDRYRMPRDSWWIDDSRLTRPPSEFKKKCAFDLMYESERQRLAELQETFEELIERVYP